MQSWPADYSVCSPTFTEIMQTMFAIGKDALHPMLVSIMIKKDLPSYLQHR